MTLAATTVWEIRTDGSATNGGGYKSNAGTTDYSQQAAAQLAVADAACNTGGAVVTSVTGGFTAAMVGSICYLAGTHFVTGWYEIIARADTNTITLDRDPTDGTNGSSGTLNVGGALNGIGTLGLVLSTAAQSVSGMKAYIRGGTYSLTGTTVNVDGGQLDLDASQQDSKSFILKGYDAGEARDSYAGTRPVIDCNDQAPANVVELKGAADEPHILAFVDILGDAGTSRNINGVLGNSQSYDRAISCIVRDCDGSSAYSTLACVNCYALSCAANAFSGCLCYGCLVNACENGFNQCSYQADCVAYNCTGDSFVGSGLTCINCVSYNSSADGFDETLDRAGVYINCISYTDGGYSFNTCAESVLYNCASDGAASGRTNVAPFLDSGAVTLTGDPFTNAAALDFSLNNTADAGAACRAVGLSPYGQTGYIDIGAVQHADPAGGGGTTIAQGLQDIEAGVIA